MIDVIVALEAELAGRSLPAGFRVHFCGVGKINAALKTAEVLARADCRRVINFGTAGSLRPELAGQLVRVNRILQRDMDARPLAALGDTPFEDGPVSGVIALGGEGVSLSTGDNFVTAPPALVSDIVDMEGYAIAKAAIRAGVDVSCWKYVTDLADENATANWRENVEKGAAAFFVALEDGRIPGTD
ncbi:MAG: 5'-methylthioadenosine nucleosidase [Candidatus Puniceispirillaceae bacterium]